ncbi:AMP-dependent synthetase, partial [Prosthecomicrobium hirschii]
KVKGMFVRPELVAAVLARHRDVGRARLVIARAGEADAMTLKAECAAPEPGLSDALAATVRSVMKLGAAIELVPPGSLPNDGKVIEDTRPVG